MIIEDLRLFAQKNSELSGEFLPLEMPRLKNDVFSTAGGSDGVVTWSVAGFIRRDQLSDATPYLKLVVNAVVSVQCQRCLSALDYSISVTRLFAFVSSEAAAEAAELDGDDEKDILAFSKNFDLGELIEDEVLLALPSHPKHDVCGEQNVDNFQKKSPFSVLAQLKKPKRMS